VVPYEGKEWKKQLNFRDYLNARADVAKEYEALKLYLMAHNQHNRSYYTQSKQAFIWRVFEEAEKWRGAEWK